MRRRQFLKTSGLLSLTPFVPAFVNSLAAKTVADRDGKILVVIELNGGNDGINTVVPYTDEAYPLHREKLQLDSHRLHTLTESLALHPSMRTGKELFDAGELAIINGVSYPNPTRSHFESLSVWHHGLLGDRRIGGEGWLGCALDVARQESQTTMDGYFIGRQALPEALVSRRAQVAALSRFADLMLDPALGKKTTIEMPAGTTGDIVDFVQRQMSSAYASSRQMESLVNRKENNAFPDNVLGHQMQTISQLIRSGSGARVYYTVQGGYDTHSTQTATHANLLLELSSAIKALIDDLKQNGLDEQVVVMAFSEFGRRVQENASLGTDHGTAGPVFLAGTKLKPGIHGEPTNLYELEDGEVKTQFDFRQVYATLLDDWLEIPSSDVLGEEFATIDLF